MAKVRQSTGARQVDILGHSQGTLMPDYYAKFLGGAPYIHSYVSLAPLWHGTSLGAPQQLSQSMSVYSPSSTRDARLPRVQPDEHRLGRSCRRCAPGEWR